MFPHARSKISVVLTEAFIKHESPLRHSVGLQYISDERFYQLQNVIYHCLDIQKILNPIPQGVICIAHT